MTKKEKSALDLLAKELDALSRSLASSASDLAEAHPNIADEANEPWNEGGAGYRLCALIKAFKRDLDEDG